MSVFLVHVIALLDGNDPDLILRCLRAGAVEFLIHPFTVEQVDAAFAKLGRLQGSGELQIREPAKLFAVMPAKGGCGGTTLAANLAFQMKRLGAKRVLLADMDMLAGVLSFVLKIKSIYTLPDALAARQRARQRFMGRDGDGSQWRRTCCSRLI